MTSFMRLLRSVAQKHGLCVLVSILSLVCSYPRPIWTVRPVEMAWCANREPYMQVLNDATAAGHPALGASFTFLTDATVWLARLPGQDHEMRTAQVLRSRVSVRIHPPAQVSSVLTVSHYQATGARCSFQIRRGRVLAT